MGSKYFHRPPYHGDACICVQSARPGDWDGIPGRNAFYDHRIDFREYSYSRIDQILNGIKMKTVFLVTLVMLIVFVYSSCETGYVKKGHNWVWVTNDENFGSRDHWIEGIDMESFKVLKQNKNFATDKYSAYFRGRKISHATSDDFVPLTDDAYGYAKDNYRVFFDNEVILTADPETFEVLEFPYSRDKKDVYNGTLPMNLDKNDVGAFKVINDDKLMKGMKSTMLLSEFLNFNPEYQWIENLDIEVKWVIAGRWGTGEANGKKYKGLEEIK